MSSPKFLNSEGLSHLWEKAKEEFVTPESLEYYHDSTKQDLLIPGDNITINSNTISTKDSQVVAIDCSQVSEFIAQDCKVYLLNNVGVLNISVSGLSERHMFINCEEGTTISYPDSWGTIPFESGTLVEISVLNGLAVFKIWDH